MLRRELLVLAVLMASLLLVQCLSLGPREGMRDVGELEEPAGKRDGGRRITRDRYRMGYMFGKRSSLEGQAAGLIIKSLTGKAISVADLAAALQTDRALAVRVARHLDRNGDGYVAVSELL